MPDPTPTDEIVAALLAREAALVDELAKVRGMLAAARGESQDTGLTAPKQDVNVHGMLKTARLHISASRSDDALAIAADKAGFTVRSLAKEIGCSASLLSQARRDNYNCSISLALAKRIEKLTGFKANKANWPRLRDE